MRNASSNEGVEEKKMQTKRDELLQICSEQIRTDVRVLLHEELQAFREEQERWRQAVLEDVSNVQRGKQFSQPAVGGFSEPAVGINSSGYDMGAIETTAGGGAPPNYASEASSVQAFRFLAFNAGSTAAKSFREAGTVTKNAMQPQFAKTLSEDSRETDKAGYCCCRFISKTLACSRWVAVLTLIIFLASFFIWGLVKISNPGNYTEIKSETLPWSGEMELPQLAVSQRGNVTIKIQHCTIHNGNIKSKICLEVDPTECKLGEYHHLIRQECMPSLSVAGTFGDALYRYVTLKVFSPKGSKEGYVSLWWEQRQSPTWSTVLTQLYSWSEKVPMRSELFFQKVVALQGESFGLFGRSGNDESEQLLKQTHYMVKHSEYTYAGERGETNSQGLIRGRTIYLRAGHTQQENFYEVYSVLRLLETMGGLYTALSFVLFVPILCAYKLMRHGVLLMDRSSHQQEQSRRQKLRKVLVEEMNFTQGDSNGGSQDTRFRFSKDPIVSDASASDSISETCVKLPGMLEGEDLR